MPTRAPQRDPRRASSKSYKIEVTVTVTKDLAVSLCSLSCTMALSAGTSATSIAQAWGLVHTWPGWCWQPSLTRQVGARWEAWRTMTHHYQKTGLYLSSMELGTGSTSRWAVTGPVTPHIKCAAQCSAERTPSRQHPDSGSAPVLLLLGGNSDLIRLGDTPSAPPSSSQPWRFLAKVSGLERGGMWWAGPPDPDHPVCLAPARRRDVTLCIWRFTKAQASKEGKDGRPVVREKKEAFCAYAAERRAKSRIGGEEGG